MTTTLLPQTTPTGTALPLPTRRFGKTEAQVPVLGLGSAPAGIGLPDVEAIALFHACIDRGVTYIDTAPGYNRAHVQLGEVMPARRDEVFLVTKAFAATAAELFTIHEQSLRDLRTECVDVLYAHGVGAMDLEQMLAPDGVFAGLRELKRRGQTRFIGFTAHHQTPKSEALLQRAISGDLEVDAVMLAMNFVDRHTYRFEERVLPLAERLDLGVACMKVFGGAREMDYEKQRISALGDRPHHPAFRYALGLPGVAVAVVGMFNQAELERNLEWAKSWEPLTAAEGERLQEDGRALAAEWGPHFGDTG
jgi:predicted aldo/keto reductase-like oxidoreductase